MCFTLSCLADSGTKVKDLLFKMKIVVLGCLHGELEAVYENVAQFEQSNNCLVDLVLICGDFQSIRNVNDLSCIAMPPKFRRLGTFHKYYFGEKVAPKLTIFVGGNHEASNYLQTLPYGGWVAPNIYYLGYCSVVKFGGIRIGGISGIFKMHDSRFGHFESLPFDQSKMRSVYHMRETEVFKLLQISEANHPNGSSQLLDIFLSHDWPINIHACGNVQYLLKKKPFFRDEINRNQLGNPLLQPLVHHLKPKHWFAAHMHVGFQAVVQHVKNQSEVDGSSCVFETNFQALDKILPFRKFMHVIEIDHNGNDFKFEYDAEWLAILRKTDHLLSIHRERVNGVSLFDNSKNIRISQKDIEEVIQLMNNDLTIPANFSPCEPVLSPNTDIDPQRQTNFTNPQTDLFCLKLSIRDPLRMIIDEFKIQNTPDIVVKNPDEIDLFDDEDDDCCMGDKANESDGFTIDTVGSNK